jgi:hypothetical protein
MVVGEFTVSNIHMDEDKREESVNQKEAVVDMTKLQADIDTHLGALKTKVNIFTAHAWHRAPWLLFCVHVLAWDRFQSLRSFLHHNALFVAYVMNMPRQRPCTSFAQQCDA